MAGATIWKSRPVFISSTFLDMQGERDFLRNVVFPDLEERLKARRHHLEWVDLRVGVANASAANEQARELEVLKVCLAEVKRSRPFLIALIGDRYGWVPPEARIKAAVVEQDFAGDVAGRSVTELEIDCGVLSDPEQRTRSYFYFREPLPYAEMGSAAAAYSEEFDTEDLQAADRARKLAALKRRIKAQFPDRVRTYSARWDDASVTGLEDLREKVTKDLWSELDAETASVAAEAVPTWQQADRAAMADFAEDRARDFVGRKKLMDRIARFASSKPGDGPWGLCVTGGSGAGKSALWGTLHARLSGAQVALVLGHAAGASTRASSVDAMLRRWIDELAAELGVPAELADDAKDDDVEAAFAVLLGRASRKRRVLVLVDALDQFEKTTRALHMTWLPQSWPDNARLIATAIPGGASEALQKRPDVEALALPPLDAADAREIVVKVCGRYHRNFEPQVIEALVAKGAADPAGGSPLWLTLAAEELNLIDADDFARAKSDYGGLPTAEALRALMCDLVMEMPGDAFGLYCWSFDRAARLFGASLTRAFLAVIARSRGGWREHDLRALVPNIFGEPWDELRFAQLRRSFRGQLRQRGALGQWDFAHGQMQPAATAWLEREEAFQWTALHTAIGDHLLALPADDPLHISETLAHLLMERGAPSRVRQYFGNASLTAAEIDGASRCLADVILAAPAAERTKIIGQVLCLLGDACADDVRSARIAGTAADRLSSRFLPMIDQRVGLDVRAALLDGIKEAYECVLTVDPTAHWLLKLSVTCDAIGAVLQEQGNPPAALKSLREGLTMKEKLAKLDLGIPGWVQTGLCISYSLIGDALVDQGNLAEALKHYSDALAVQSRLANAKPDDAVAQGNLVALHDKIGKALSLQGHPAQALQSFRAAFAIIERLAGRDASSASRQNALAGAHFQIGEILMNQGDLPGALKSFQDSLAIAQRLVSADPDNAKWQVDLAGSYGGLGEALAAQGDLPAGLRFHRQNLEIVERLAQADPGDVSLQNKLGETYSNIGGIERAQGNLTEALKLFRRRLAIAERLTKDDHANTPAHHGLGSACGDIGDVLARQSDFPGALQSFRRALAVFERLAQSDPSDAGHRRSLSLTHQRIGDLLAIQEDFEGALKCYRDSLAITEACTPSDPNNADLQHEIAGVHARMGRVLLMKGEAANALRAMRHARAIMGELITLAPDNPTWNENIAVLDEKIDLITASGIVDLEARPGRTRSPVGPGSTAARPDDASLTADAMALLNRGDAAGALALLVGQNDSGLQLQNLLAVCHLRLGQPQQSLDLLRPMIFPRGGFVPRDDADPIWLVNFATALLMRGDRNACRSALGWLKDPKLPGAVRLIGALDAWEQSRAGGGRLQRLFGAKPQQPITLGFPPGIF